MGSDESHFNVSVGSDGQSHTVSTNHNFFEEKGEPKRYRTEVQTFLCCLTSTEAGWPIRDGDRVGKRTRVIGSTAETARKRPERPWTAARTMEVLRRCPLAIAQRLVHCAIALSTAVLDRVTKTMSVAPLLTNNLDNSKQKMSNLLSPAPPPYSWSLLGKSEGPAPPPSSKISWSFDLAWNPVQTGQALSFIPPRGTGQSLAGSVRLKRSGGTQGP